MSDKERKLMKSEAIKRLDYLVSWGLSIDMLKKYKKLGRVYVNEITISDWADRNGKKNCKFPRTYVCTDMAAEVTEEMLETKMKLENDGYLVYLIDREKRNAPKKENCTDRIDYFFIDTPENKNFYEDDEEDFRNGIARAYTQIRTNEVNKDYFGEVKYKVSMEQVVVNKEEN